MVHTVCASSVPPGISGNLEISIKSVLLHCEACRLLSYKRYLPLTTLCVDENEGAMKVLSSSLVGIVLAFANSS